MPKKWDFAGWATKNDLLCSDGRVIRKNAFKVNDKQKVPLVWNHAHNSPMYVLGHAILENREEGVYAYCYFNDTENGQAAKKQVVHGDVNALSIWANNLQQNGHEVIHGIIREVSLVLAGANPGAFIESVLAHGEPMEDFDSEGIFYTNSGLELAHADKEEDKKEDPKDDKESDDSSKKEEDDDKSKGKKSVKEVYDTFTEDQKKVVGVIVAEVAKGGGKKSDDSKSDEDDKKEEKEMKHNVFDRERRVNVLSHSDVEAIFEEGKRLGSLKLAVSEAMKEGGILAHAINTEGMETPKGNQDYGFNDPSMLFPDYKSLNTPPDWISREMGWVQKVMAGVHHTPFSRIKSQYANITEDEARARGYIKGKQKKTEVFTVLKRVTEPTTVYKFQKMDRDDIVDITDFDVVAWIKAEMRVMLDEEIARAILIGDGRDGSDESKIPEDHIRPIATDVPLFNTKVPVNVAADASSDVVASETIDAVIRARKHYKGSGNPTFFTTEDVLTEMLLLKDAVGHRLYKTEAELATALRVKEIVTVEPMEGYKVEDDTKTERDLIGIIVNLADYNVGADKGGEVNLFDDFDLNFNKYEYLIETRISGALIKPFSALTIYKKPAA